MNCLNPIRIRNQYTGEWMFVGCNHCEGCLSEKIVRNVSLLSAYMKRFKYIYLVTLTYDNNHVPFVIDGRPEIFRYDGKDISEILEVTDSPFNCKDCPKLVGHDLKFAVGVLYYRDIQLFFKRLRKYLSTYGSKPEIKSFVCCEYGSLSKRPHYHLAICSDTIPYDTIKAGIIKSWQLHDWSRLDEEQCIKVGFSNLSSYLASYINCCSGSSGFYEDKRIKQKVRRSKDISYIVNDEMEEEIKRFFYRGSNFGREFDLQRFFRYINKRSKNACSSLSFDVFSTNFLSAYFSKPKGYDRLSSNSQYRRIAEIVRFYRTRKEVGKYLDCDGNISSIGFYMDGSSSDYKTWLSYRRFCNLFGYDVNSLGSLLVYCDSFNAVRNYVASLNLYKQMLHYKDSPDTYFLECYNTDLDDLEKRHYRNLMRSRLNVRALTQLEEGVLSPRLLKRRNEFINQNRLYFLPKHINSLLKYGKKYL